MYKGKFKDVNSHFDVIQQTKLLVKDIGYKNSQNLEENVGFSSNEFDLNIADAFNYLKEHSPENIEDILYLESVYSKGNVQEKTLENSYKNICYFEKPHFEKLQLEDDGSVILTIDKELFLKLDDSEKTDDNMFEPVKYTSYNALFNERYRNNFKRNLTAINYKTLEKELGSDTMARVTQKDKELKGLYTELTKERDLDNDGIPDRIDIDDTRNSVQTVSDLHSVRNSTSSSTERFNKKQERQAKENKRNHELEI